MMSNGPEDVQPPTVLKLQTIEKFKPVLTSRALHPYVTLYGGRNGVKSWFAMQYAVLTAIQGSQRVVIAREILKSIKESSKKLVGDTIDRMGVRHLFKETLEGFDCLTGSTIRFMGLHRNIDSVKSMESVDLVIIEEAENVSEESYDILLPTIRKEGSQIVIVFNPKHKLSPTYRRWVTNPPEGTLVIKTSYADNPWLTEKSRKEIETMKAEDYAKYQYRFQGIPIGGDDLGIIRPEWFAAAIDAHEKLNFDAEGMRVFSLDPADGGSDDAVGVARHGSVITDIKVFDKQFVEATTRDTYKYMTQCGIIELIYDVIGVGVGCRGTLATIDPENRINATPFDARSKASKVEITDDSRTDLYKNARSEFIFELAERFRKTYIAVTKGRYFPPEELISISSDIDAAIIEQLEYETTHIREKANTSFKQVESKDDMAKRGLKSPNMFDALYMVFYPPEKTVTFDMASIDFGSY